MNVSRLISNCNWLAYLPNESTGKNVHNFLQIEPKKNSRDTERMHPQQHGGTRKCTCPIAAVALCTRARFETTTNYVLALVRCCYTLDDRQDNSPRQLGRLTVKQVVKLGCSLFFDSMPDSEATVRRWCRMDLLYRFIINKLVFFFSYFKR